MTDTEVVLQNIIVLVVDDDPGTRLLMRKSLERVACQVVEAASGSEALSTFQEQAPDVVLLDVQMPGVDGFVVCEQIRSLPEADATPIIMVTGHDDQNSVDRAYKAGATHFISKPVNWASLHYHVRYVYRTAQSYKALRRSEARVKAILEAIPDTIFILTPESVYEDRVIAKHAAAIMSYPDLSNGDRVSKTPDSFHARFASLQQALAYQGVRTCEYSLAISGETRHFEARLLATAADEILTIVRDITVECSYSDPLSAAFYR